MGFSTLGGAGRGLGGEFGFDECEGLGAVFVDVLLVRVGIVAVAAVGVCGVAVGLDDAGAGGGALETGGAGGELEMCECVVGVVLEWLLTPPAVHVPTL